MNFPRLLCVFAILFGLCAIQACSEGQKLVGIMVSPPNTSITGGPLSVDYSAFGNYVHPPESKDLTHSVVWSSSSPQIVSIDPNTGVATSSPINCGNNILITAALYTKPGNPASGTVAVGTATVSLTQPGGCT